MRCSFRHALLITLASSAVWTPAAMATQDRAVASDGEFARKPVLIIDGEEYRDLNANGSLDPYEDRRRSIDERVEDLLAQMTLREKAGAMMMWVAPNDVDSFPPPRRKQYKMDETSAEILDEKVTGFLSRLDAQSPSLYAEENNRIQAVAESARLGIPVTLSSDPRNHFQEAAGISVRAGAFSLWPQPTGIGAVGDCDLARRFGETVRQEYRAVGLTMALSPQADLATEPRWGRISGTFGESPELVSKLVGCAVEGMQGSADGVVTGGVTTMVKHWVGYGAAKDGWDSHKAYGRYASFPGNDFEDHVKAFQGAFDAHAAGVMTTYSILEGLQIDGKPVEQVGGTFSKAITHDLLRETKGFDGLVISDFFVFEDCPDECYNGLLPGKKDFDEFILAMPWGVEDKSKSERMAMALDAGLDIFGGSKDVDLLVGLVESGRIAPERIDQSVRRVLAAKFRNGLFDNPYVDPAKAEALLGDPKTHAWGRLAQTRSLTLLKNDGVLPLAKGTRVYSDKISDKALKDAGLVPVAKVDEADVAIIRAISAGEHLHPNYLLGGMVAEGRLDFRKGDTAFDELMAASAQVPTIFSVFLDRPAVLTSVLGHASALVGNYGVSDAALLDALTGTVKAQGKLPFELPYSMIAVEEQREDVPADSQNPLFPLGYGMEWPAAK